MLTSYTFEKVLLSNREQELLQEVFDHGCSTPRISKKWGISATTIKTHWDNIFVKLAVHNKTDAVSMAIRMGILNVGAAA